MQKCEAIVDLPIQKCEIGRKLPIEERDQALTGNILEEHMKRQAMLNLAKWADSSRRKPLILTGARQVGKTWLLNEFGKEHFDNVAYISFENNKRMPAVLEG